MIRYILSLLNIAAIVLLAICYFFESYLRLPVFLEYLGRFHLLVLHLPIGMYVFSFLLYWTYRYQDARLVKRVLSINSLAAILTAILGLFLAQSPGYEYDSLVSHKNTGVVLAVIMYLWSLLSGKKYWPVANVLSLSAGIMMIWAGHEGGKITHGEDFLSLTSKELPTRVYTEESTIYDVAIQSIFDKKCVSCHKPGKSKGGLIMTDTENLIKGGKSGPTIVLGALSESKLWDVIKRPLGDKMHMPPKGQAQLSVQEIEIIEAWLSDEHIGYVMRVKDLPEGHDLKDHCIEVIQSNQAIKSYDFPFVSADLIKSLSTDYVKIRPLAAGVPALSARFFVASQYDPSSLKGLSKLSNQLVQLSLSHMPIDDRGVNDLLKFRNVEKLFLNFTDITDKGFNELAALPNLTYLSLSGTKITSQISKSLPNFKSLRELYISDTEISYDVIESWRREYPEIQFHAGLIEDEDTAPLSIPKLNVKAGIVDRNTPITLSHVISGVEIRYTLDGSAPDSTSQKYVDPIAMSDFLHIRAIAGKKGWASSPVADYKLISAGLKPSNIKLVNMPNVRYRAEMEETLFDDKRADLSNFTKGWLGFKEDPMIIDVSFNTPITLEKLVVGTGVNVPAYIFPATSMELYGSDDRKNYSLLKRVSLAVIGPDEGGLTHTDAILLAPELASSYKHFRVVAKNLPRIPNWHPGKGTPGWLFVDELLFYGKEVVQ